MDTLEQQARIFTDYLVHKDADTQSINLYKTAMTGAKLDQSDKKLLKFVTDHPLSIGFIDAGLVFHNDSSEIRRRLYVMLAILESSVYYCDLFLPKERSPLYVFVIFYSGVRASVKAALGLLLIKVVC